MSKWTVMRGLRELKKEGLLDVEYDAALNERGVFKSGRWPNRYRLRPLLSQEEREARWEGLKGRYGEEKVAQARKLVFKVEQGHNVHAVESFIRILEEYPEEWVERATQKAGRMRADNPARHVGYIVGILQSWSEQRYVD